MRKQNGLEQGKIEMRKQARKELQETIGRDCRSRGSRERFREYDSQHSWKTGGQVKDISSGPQVSALGSEGKCGTSD